MNRLSSRRQHMMKWMGLTTLAMGKEWPSMVMASDSLTPKSVAAVITAYEPGLHADVLVGKILEGWNQDGGPGPSLRLASMYIDQFGPRDTGREMAKKHGVPIYSSIEKALTLGTDRIVVDGVLSIGEHGDYPWNEKEQHLYPRRRFFQEITDAMAKHRRVVPVFNDKHLGPTWEDAVWMYERAKAYQVPFMAGSSLTVGFRSPEMRLPPNCEIEAALGIGYSGLDIYGAHALEFFQSYVEKRRGGESGVRSVQCLVGSEVWKSIDAEVVPPILLKRALEVTPMRPGSIRDGVNAALFLFEYVDGFRGVILMLPDHASGTSLTLRLKGEATIRATAFEERTEPKYPHFAYLLKAIERMIHTGKPSYPVERTLLTSGILDRLLTSRHEKQKKLSTPELAIPYQPVDYPHAPNPPLSSSPIDH